MSWNDLSMRDRASYIKLAIDSGISSLSTIRDTYNKFSDGGSILDKKKIYNRLPAMAGEYPNLDPFGISVGISSLSKYLFNSDDYVENLINNSKRVIKSADSEDKEFLDRFNHANSKSKQKYTKESFKDYLKGHHNEIIGLEDAKDVYLGMPQRSNTFVPATEQPAIGELINPHKSTYLSSPKITEKYLIPMRNKILTGDIDKKALGKSGKNIVTVLPILGNATVGIGTDRKRGDYISYYDKWDIDLGGGSNTKDIIGPIIGGKPFEIYDKIYLDDYYGVSSYTNPKDGYYGGWLPEATIVGDKSKIKTLHERNQKALGGNLFADGSKKVTRYKSSSSIRKQISTWEGETMKTNTPFDKMDIMFNQVLPKGGLEKLSQEQLDGLYSFAYNVGTGRFKTRTAPTLAKYLQGNATIEDVKNTMWASLDKKYRGLANRRRKERSMLGAYVPIQETTPMATPIDTPLATPMDITPAVQPTIESNPVIQDNIETPPLAFNIESQEEPNYTPGFFDYVNYINQIRQPKQLKQRDRRIWLTI